MEEENVSKDFTNKQITIDIPKKSERPVTRRTPAPPDRLPNMTSKEELEPEYSFEVTGSAELLGCAPAPRMEVLGPADSILGCAPAPRMVVGCAPAPRMEVLGLESPKAGSVQGCAPVPSVAHGKKRPEESVQGCAPAPRMEVWRLSGCAPVPSVAHRKKRPEESEADREDTSSSLHSPTSDWIIYRVPNKLRKIRPAAYTPQLVSIGPFHHGKSNLKAMEDYKAKYMNKFLKRFFYNHIKEEDLINAITEEDGKFLKKAQHRYQKETLEPENKKKYWNDPKNILRDACFILELFLRNYKQEEDKKKKQLADKDNACFILELFLRNHKQEEDKKKKQLADKDIKDNACFIYERCFRNHETQTQTPDKEEDEKYSRDYILKPWVKAAIKQDLILLENQLPFSVLIQLFNFIINYPSININEEPNNNEGDPLTDSLILITCKFFIDYYKYGKPCSEENSKNKSNPFEHSVEDEDHWKSEMKHIKHFTDLVRKFMYDKEDDFAESSDYWTLCHSAKQLDNAGVTFGRPKPDTYLTRIKIWPDDKCCWWNGRGCCWINCLELKIPHLRVDDNTECIFRNVMALEQFVYPDEPRICNYIFLLDQLINTVEDVDLLIDKRIVENWLGSNKAVVDLVNKLNDQIVLPRFLYSGICNELNKYHSKKLNVARSTLKRVYFKDIWTGSSTVVGLVFLVFSLFSTYSTIKNLFFV